VNSFQIILFGLVDGQERLLDILQSYFRNAASYHPDEGDAGSTTYFSRIGMSFILQSANAVSKIKLTSPLFSRHVNLLQSLASGLRNFHDDPGAPSPDYLFFASLAYVYRLLYYGPSDAITTETGRDLIFAILQYHERIIPRKDIEDGFYNSYGDTFDVAWPYFVDRARKLGVAGPPPDEESPAAHALISKKNLTTHMVMHYHHASIQSSSEKKNDG